jgi:ELWxxDGT repeat protein
MNIPSTTQKLLIILLLSCAISFIASAQSVGLLKDINTVTTNNASNPQSFASIGSIMCFAATTDLGTELWISDGTNGGTILLKDINPGNASGDVSKLITYNGVIYFIANDGVNGKELWRTDGTPQGTYLFKDINTGSGSSDPEGFTIANGILFFSAVDATHGEELWKTDGTAGGTVMVKDIKGGAGGSAIGGITAFNNKVVFTANAGSYDSDPYISDGTAGGTVKLKDINTVANSDPGGYYSAGVLMYFSAHNYTNSYEPWVTDGTQAGTRILKNINLQSAPFVTDADSYPGYFTLFNGYVYFSATDGLGGRELYRTDGTEAGTVLFKEINLTPDGSGTPGKTDGSGPDNFIVYNNTLYFTATDGTNYGLWKTDGTTGGTSLVKVLGGSASFFIFNNALYFTQYDAANGSELWKTDGTAIGTGLVKDLNPGSASASPQNYFVFGSNFYFAAIDAVGKNELWKSDGTSSGTSFLKDINLSSGNSNPGMFTTVGSQSFFIANDGTIGAELWKTDGTSTGTSLIKDIRNGASGTTVYATAVLNDTWIALLNNGSYGLWKSDGTANGTELLGNLTAYANKLTVFNNQAYFGARDVASNYELWKTDGTVTGTTKVAEINPSGSSDPDNLTVSNNTLFFTANDGTNGYAIWKTNGTQGGTTLVKNINNASYFNGPVYLTDLNGTLIFRAFDTQLWKSDGTEAGTVMIKNISGGFFVYPSYLTKAGNYVFFSASDGTNGTELWRTDGTTAGTILVKDINTATADASSSPEKLININGTLYFVATDGVNGKELWKSDGTANGTVMVKNCNGSSTDSAIDNLINFNGTLYFTATNAAGAKKLWKTDGTQSGTVEISGPGEVIEMLPSNLAVFGSKLIFSGLDAEAGIEPFIYDPDGIPNAIITDHPDNLTICSTGSASFAVAASNAITYQWQVKIGTNAFTDLTNTGVYSGVNTSTMNIGNVNGLNGYQYRCVVSNGFINTNSNAATLVAITPSAPTSVSANNTSLCSGNPVSLSANCSIGTVQWYNQTTGGTLIGTGSPLSQSPTVSTTYYAACKNGSCEGSRTATSTVNVTTSPVSPTGISISNTNICNGSSITLTATCATGTVRWYSQATGGSHISSSSPRVLSPTANTTYYVACNDGTCESVRVFVGDVTINVQPTPPSSVSFSQTSICEGTSITMTTSCATGTVIWYNQVSGGSVIGTGSPFTHSPATTTRYYATCKNEFCESSVYTSSQISVSPVPLPTGVSVNTTSVCSGQSVTLTGTCSSGTLRWYTQESGGSAVITGSPVSHSPTANTTYYAACRVGACERERIATEPVTVITLPNTPSSVSVNNTAVCLGESVSLTASCSAGTLTWYNQATGGSSIGTASPLSQIPTVTGRYYASCKNGACESTRGQTSEINVNSVAAPAGVSVNTTSVCSGESVTLTATCSTGTIRWYTQATGGTSVASGSPATQSPTVNTTYYASCRSGSCESSRVATAIVTMASTPANPTGVSVNNTNVCTGESVSLTATCATGTITWYNQVTGGSIIGTGALLSQNVVTATTFYASCKSNCNESSRIPTSQVFVSRDKGGLVNPQVNSLTVSQNNIYFYKTTISQGMTADSMAVIVGPGFLGGARIKPGIYSDNSGTPDILLASSSGNSNISLPTLPVGTSKFPLLSNVYLNAGTYWIGFVLSSQEKILYNESGANGGYYKAQTFSNALPTSITGLTANAMQEFNVYFSGNSDCTIPGEPTNISTPPTSVCEGSLITLSATCATGVAIWYTHDIGGTALGTGSPFTFTATINLPEPAKTENFNYYVSCKNGANESNRIYAGHVVVNDVTVPTFIGTSKYIYCAGESITLTASCTSGTVRWYNQATGGSIISTANTMTIPSGLQNSTTYYATCNVTNCESGRSALLVQVGTNTRKYVKFDAVGANNGTSWQNAYTSLQSAIENSCAGAEIWIAKGTYYPTKIPSDTANDSRLKCFFYSEALFIYGGFAGNETQLSERDITGNPTILSGDFNNDDIISGEGSTLSITNNTENAYHVLITGGPNIGGTIDGIMIKGGNGSGPSDSFNGYSGGLIYYAGPTLPEGQYSLTLSNVTFTGNSSNAFGGGMLIAGGGIQIKNSKFIKNQSARGGALISTGSTNLTDAVFEGNRALNEGGAIWTNSGIIIVNRVYFKNNSAGLIGGAYINEGAKATIDNSIFTGNSASYGGALFTASTNNFTITNTTIAKNTATNGGGLVYSNSSTVNLKNTIIWGNTASSSTNNAGYFVHPTTTYPLGTPTLNQTNSLIQGFGTANGNIDANPLFNNENDADGADNKFFTADDGFNLTPCSPAINAGTNTGIETTDILNNIRPFNSGTADIGAFEYAGLPEPTNITVSATDICTPTNITLSATCAIGTVTWYNQATGGSAIGTGASFSQLVSQYSRYYVSCKDNCAESSRAGSSTIYYDAFSPPAVMERNPSVCTNKSILLSAACPAGTISWYNANGTTLIGTGGMFTTPNLTINTTYKVRCEEGACSSPFVDVTVNIAANPIIQISGSDNLNCTTTSVTRTASGGSTYLWSNGLGTNATAIITVPGTYTVTATNASGCTATASTIVTQDGSLPSPPTIVEPNQKVTCAVSGSNSINLTLQANGCAGTVQWSSGATGFYLILTAPGTYSVSANCTVGSCKSAESTLVTGLEIIPPTMPPTIIEPSQKVVCWPNTITLVATGCTGTVTWTNGSTGTSITLSSIGTYSILAGCTERSCSSGGSNVITGLEIVGQPSAPTINAANPKVVCAPGTLTLTASGCAGTVNWSNGGSGSSTTLSSVGTYSISATCTVGSCTSVASSAVTGLQIVNQPSAPTINAPNPKVVCAPGTLTLTASGCAGTVNWSNGGSGYSIALSSVGTYSISATCTVGSCTSVASSAVTGLQIVNQPSAPTINAPNPKVVCAPGTLTLTASGCAGTVNWSNGGSGSSIMLSSVGTYSISATCTVGSCTSVASSAVTGLQIVNQPSAPTINAPNPKVVCASGTLTLTASGCAGTVNWSNGGSGSSIALSSVGTYSISATCTVGSCTSVASSAVTGLQIVNQPSAPTINAPNPKVVCAPGTLTLTASGCAGTVNWSNGGSGSSIALSSVGTYSISASCTVGSCTSVASNVVTGLQIVTPPTVNITGNTNLSCTTVSVTRTANGSGLSPTYQWSNGLGTDATVTINAPGTYTVTVTGTGGCTATATTAVSVDSSLPDSPIILATNPKVVCAPGTLTLTASGCAGTVNWSNGATGTIITLSSAGTYSISATCTVGSCTSVASQSVTGLQIVTQPSPPIINAPNQKIICSPSTLVLTASGCGGTINWSNGSNGSSITLSSVGTYSISATCSVGSCISVASSSITGLQILNQVSAPTINPPNPKVVCAPGTLTLTASGCAGTVNWSNGGSGTSIILSSVGSYSISATCTVGSCTSVESSPVTGLQIVNQPSAPAISAPNSKVVCAPGTLTLTASGCAGTVNWSNGSSGTSLILSTIGTYSISATCTVGSCTSVESSPITGLQIVNQPSAPTINAPNPKVVCAPGTLTLTASGCAGTVNWSNGGSGTSITLSSVGSYSISATCTVGSCTSVESSPATGLQILNQPSAPAISAPNPKVVCAPGTLTLTASGCAGTVNWSNGSSGTSLILSTIGTYSISATCTVGSCTSVESSPATGLQILNQPSAPTISAPNPKVVCAPGTLTLTASGCAGTVNWSNGSSGTSLILSTIGTYSISATCTIGSCISASSTAMTGLEIIASPIANASNTGPYNVGQTIQLNATGGNSYKWSGPNNFTSNIANPGIANALTANAGIYTVTISNGSCSATATTQVIVNGSDPCTQVIDLIYVKSGNPYQPLFSLKDGMIIQEMSEQVSVMAVPICQSTPIGSVDLTIVGPDLNWTILQNVEPFALFDNLGSQFNGRNLKPGTYTFTVTGYPEDNKAGGIVYGPVITTFTIVGNSASISAPTVTNNSLCSGSSVNVNFNTTGSFATGNEFLVQLSDINGSFVNPVIIGISNIAGNVVCQIPQSITGGSGYLIRVVSTNQVIAGNPVNTQLSILPSVKNFTTDINSGIITEQASQKITAANKIIAPANVNYRAGRAIELSPGFFANTGAVFKAEIGGCNN